MTLRVTDFLDRLSGDLDVMIISKKTILDCGTLEEIKTRRDLSFDALDGFDNNLWEMEVKNFKFKETIIGIYV